jgi:hypothetical protein
MQPQSSERLGFWGSWGRQGLGRWNTAGTDLHLRWWACGEASQVRSSCSNCSKQLYRRVHLACYAACVRRVLHRATPLCFSLGVLIVCCCYAPSIHAQVSFKSCVNAACIKLCAVPAVAGAGMNTVAPHAPDVLLITPTLLCIICCATFQVPA